MNRIFVTVIATALLLPFLVSARDAGAAPVQYPAANLEDDTYQPGPGWQLVWADEF
jgi:hypothetical protein